MHGNCRIDRGKPVPRQHFRLSPGHVHVKVPSPAVFTAGKPVFPGLAGYRKGVPLLSQRRTRNARRSFYGMQRITTFGA
jgi:hypothetical protein